MRLIVTLMVVAFVVGFLLKGNLDNLASMKLRYWPLAFFGYALQVFPFPSSWGHNIPIACLLASFVLLLFFALANLRQPGFKLIVAGVMLNFIVIAANWGMPVSAAALRASDQAEVVEELRLEPGQKHHLADRGDHFRFLGDVIPFPNPIHLALSIGDVLMYGGVGTLIALRMRRPDPERPPPSESRPESSSG